MCLYKSTSFCEKLLIFFILHKLVVFLNSSVHVNQAYFANSGQQENATSQSSQVRTLFHCEISLWGRYRKNSRKRERTASSFSPPRPATPAPNWICHMTTALARRLRNKTESTNKSLTMYFMRFNPRFTNKYYYCLRSGCYMFLRLNKTLLLQMTYKYLRLFQQLKSVSLLLDSTNLLKI